MSWVDDIELRTTILRVKRSMSEDDSEKVFDMFKDNDWVVTHFARNTEEEFLYEVQPLENLGDGQTGITGMWAYVLTEEELITIFDRV